MSINTQGWSLHTNLPSQSACVDSVLLLVLLSTIWFRPLVSLMPELIWSFPILCSFWWILPHWSNGVAKITLQVPSATQENVISFSRRNSPGHCLYVSLKDWGVLSKIPWGVSSVKQREDKSLCVAPAFQEKAPVSTEKRGKRLLCKVHSVWDWSRGSDPFTSC